MLDLPHRSSEAEHSFDTKESEMPRLYGPLESDSDCGSGPCTEKPNASDDDGDDISVDSCSECSDDISTFLCSDFFRSATPSLQNQVRAHIGSCLLSGADGGGFEAGLLAGEDAPRSCVVTTPQQQECAFPLPCVDGSVCNFSFSSAFSSATLGPGTLVPDHP